MAHQVKRETADMSRRNSKQSPKGTASGSSPSFTLVGTIFGTKPGQLRKDNNDFKFVGFGLNNERPLPICPGVESVGKPCKQCKKGCCASLPPDTQPLEEIPIVYAPSGNPCCMRCLQLHSVFFWSANIGNKNKRARVQKLLKYLQEQCPHQSHEHFRSLRDYVQQIDAGQISLTKPQKTFTATAADFPSVATSSSSVSSSPVPAVANSGSSFASMAKKAASPAARTQRVCGVSSSSSSSRTPPRSQPSKWFALDLTGRPCEVCFHHSRITSGETFEHVFVHKNEDGENVETHEMVTKGTVTSNGCCSPRGGSKCTRLHLPVGATVFSVRKYCYEYRSSVATSFDEETVMKTIKQWMSSDKIMDAVTCLFTHFKKRCLKDDIKFSDSRVSTKFNEFLKDPQTMKFLCLLQRIGFMEMSHKTFPQYSATEPIFAGVETYEEAEFIKVCLSRLAINTSLCCPKDEKKCTRGALCKFGCHNPEHQIGADSANMSSYLKKFDDILAFWNRYESDRWDLLDWIADNIGESFPLSNPSYLKTLEFFEDRHDNRIPSSLTINCLFRLMSLRVLLKDEGMIEPYTPKWYKMEQKYFEKYPFTFFNNVIPDMKFDVSGIEKVLSFTVNSSGKGTDLPEAEGVDAVEVSGETQRDVKKEREEMKAQMAPVKEVVQIRDLNVLEKAISARFTRNGKVRDFLNGMKKDFTSIPAKITEEDCLDKFQKLRKKEIEISSDCRKVFEANPDEAVQYRSNLVRDVDLLKRDLDHHQEKLETLEQEKAQLEEEKSTLGSAKSDEKKLIKVNSLLTDITRKCDNFASNVIPNTEGRLTKAKKALEAHDMFLSGVVSHRVPLTIPSDWKRSVYYW